MTDYKWLFIENVILYLTVAVLFLLTRSGWVFILLLFVNIKSRREEKDA